MQLRTRVAAFFAAQFFGLGLFLPFFPLLLNEAGLGAGEIGTLLAVPMIVRLIANPLVSGLADRYATPASAITTLSFLSLVGFSGFFFIGGFVPLFLLLMVTAFVWSPLMPLGDALAARVEREGGGDYGRMRLWGSVSFIVANLIGGVLVGGWTREVVIGGIIAGLVCAVAVGRGLPGRPEAVATDGVARSWTGVTTVLTPGFLMVLCATGLIQASHAAYYAFSALFWAEAGIPGTAVGLFWGLGVVTEIGLFAIAGQLGLRFGIAGLLGLGAAGATLRWLLFPLATDPVSVALLQALHGLSFGASHLGAVAYVARTAPPRWAGTAQGVMSMMVGLLTALASAMAGQLYAFGPALAFHAMAGLSAAGGALLVASVLRRRWRGGGAGL